MYFGLLLNPITSRGGVYFINQPDTANYVGATPADIRNMNPCVSGVCCSVNKRQPTYDNNNDGVKSCFPENAGTLTTGTTTNDRQTTIKGYNGATCDSKSTPCLDSEMTSGKCSATICTLNNGESVSVGAQGLASPTGTMFYLIKSSKCSSYWISTTCLN